jgi:hypothetical protein
VICRQVQQLFYRQAVRNRYLKRDSRLVFPTSNLLYTAQVSQGETNVQKTVSLVLIFACSAWLAGCRASKESAKETKQPVDTATDEDPGWPREITNQGSTLLFILKVLQVEDDTFGLIAATNIKDYVNQQSGHNREKPPAQCPKGRHAC